MTDFVNLKIKSAQSFKVDHRNIIYVCVFIRMSVHICMGIYIYNVLLKKICKTSLILIDRAKESSKRFCMTSGPRCGQASCYGPCTLREPAARTGFFLGLALSR
jgi:hypothetical protein